MAGMRLVHVHIILCASFCQQAFHIQWGFYRDRASSGPRREVVEADDPGRKRIALVLNGEALGGGKSMVSAV